MAIFYDFIAAHRGAGRPILAIGELCKHMPSGSNILYKVQGF